MLPESRSCRSRGIFLSFAEIVDGVFLIDTLAARVPGLVAGYLIKAEKSALIDVGYPTSANAVLSELRKLDDNKWHVDYLIPTHVHLDHAGAAGHLAKAMPHARVLVNEHGAKHLIDPTKLTLSATSVFGDEAMSVFGTPLPVPRERIEPVRDFRRLDLGAGKILRIFWTPGHAWHHMSILLEKECLLFTGDAVGLHYPGFPMPIPATPPPGFDADRYVKTLTGFVSMNPTGLLLPHFGQVRENVRGFLDTNLETINRWSSRALEAVKAGDSVDETFEFFINDVACHSGKSREEIPDHIARSIMLSAMGCYTYARATEANK